MIHGKTSTGKYSIWFDLCFCKASKHTLTKKYFDGRQYNKAAVDQLTDRQTASQKNEKVQHRRTAPRRMEVKDIFCLH